MKIPNGAAVRLGVKPDLITLAKSIGGGLPLAAFGGTEEVMQVVVDDRNWAGCGASTGAFSPRQGWTTSG